METDKRFKPSRLFEGRIGRRHFIGGILLFVTIVLMVTIGLATLFEAEIGGNSLFIIVILFLVTLFSLYSRRAHDIGYPGGTALSVFVPGLNLLFLILLSILPGEKKINKYGSRSKGGFLEVLLGLSVDNAKVTIKMDDHAL
jgi:uncharacterized membrane protein YhaH (DUF805 family)